MGLGCRGQAGIKECVEWNRLGLRKERFFTLFQVALRSKWKKEVPPEKLVATRSTSKSRSWFDALHTSSCCNGHSSSSHHRRLQMLHKHKRMKWKTLMQISSIGNAISTFWIHIWIGFILNFRLRCIE